MFKNIMYTSEPTLLKMQWSNQDLFVGFNSRDGAAFNSVQIFSTWYRDKQTRIFSRFKDKESAGSWERLASREVSRVSWAAMDSSTVV